jgi:hypothetical protein
MVYAEIKADIEHISAKDTSVNQQSAAKRNV